MFVTQEDINEINGLQGIKCTMSAANTFYQSGALTLRKPPGTCRNFTQKSNIALMHLNSQVSVHSVIPTFLTGE